MAYTYTNTYSFAGVGINGLTVNAYKASRFSSAPALNASPPGGGADATTTTGTAAGSPGAFAIALPTSEDYYISVTNGGTVSWLGPVSQVFADGTAQGGAAPAGQIGPTKGGNTLDDGSGNAKLGGYLDLGNSSSASQITGGTGIGDKILLYGGAGQQYGFGLQAFRLVAFLANNTGFGIRPVSGTGALSSGTDQFIVTVTASGAQVTTYTAGGVARNTLDDGSGNATFGGIVTENGTITKAITSGALPTTTFVSGTGKQILTTRDVDIVIPWTGGSSASTLVVALSPDNVTYSTLVTLALPASSTGTTTMVPLTVPAGWWVKLTNTNGTIGTGTYY